MERRAREYFHHHETKHGEGRYDIKRMVEKTQQTSDRFVTMSRRLFDHGGSAP